jgi:hypothetical protein
MRSSTRSTIAAVLNASWALPNIPLTWENQPDVNAARSSWARAAITWGTTMPAAVGDTHTRMIGFVSLQIFVPDAKGTAAAHAAVDHLDLILGNKRLGIAGTGWTGEIVFETGPIGPAQAGAREGYVQWNAQMNFRVDRFKG